MNDELVTRSILREELKGFATKDELFEFRSDLADVRVELVSSIETVERKFDVFGSKLDFLVEQAGGDRMDALEMEVSNHEKRISAIESSSS